MNPRVVFITASSLKEAETIAHALLEPKVAVCVQIIPGVQSHYWWQGQIESAAEWLLLIKTSAEQWDDVVATVKKHHSYDVPEIVALEPAEVEEKYRAWWQDEGRR